MKKRKVYALALCKGIISAFLLWLILRHVDVHTVVIRLQGIALSKFVLAVSIGIGGVLFAALRWRILADPILTFSDAVKYTWIGSFWGAILPGGISGDVAKAAALALKDPRARVFDLPLSVFMDRISGLVTLLVFFNIGCALMTWGNYLSGNELHYWVFNGFLLSGVGILCSMLLTMPTARELGAAMARRVPIMKLRIAIERCLAGLSQYVTNPGRLVNGLLLSLIIHTLSVIQYILVIQALHLEMSLPVAAAFYSIISVAILVPVTVSGIGVREWVCVLFFASVGLSAVDAMAFAWLQLLGSLIFAMIGAVVQVLDLCKGRAPVKG
jgi:uncharacterized protein (TIRG00374 family)